MQSSQRDRLLIRGSRDAEARTVGQVAVASAADDVTQGALDALVAGEVERVGGSGPHHGDVEAPQRPEDPFCLDDPLQGLVHALVLSVRLRLQALHPSLAAGKKTKTNIKPNAVFSLRLVATSEHLMI